MSETTVPVTRTDLRHFDSEATRLILWAQEQGARIRLTSRGHALIFGPKGGSATIGPKSKSVNRAAKNHAATVRRLFKEGTDR